MQDALQRINQVAGVRGSALFNLSGECIAALTPPPYEPILLNQLMTELQAAFQVHHYLETEGVEQLSMHCEGGNLLVRKVYQYLVLVLTDASVNSAMVDVAINVMSLKLKGAEAGVAAMPAQAAVGGAIAATPFSGTSLSDSRPGNMVDASTSLPAVSFASLGQTGNIPQSQSGPKLSTTLLRALRDVCTKHMGADAKAIMKEELAKLGATSGKIRVSYDELVALLSRRLPPHRRTAFADEARALPSTMK